MRFRILKTNGFWYCIKRKVISFIIVVLGLVNIFYLTLMLQQDKDPIVLQKRKLRDTIFFCRITTLRHIFGSVIYLADQISQILLKLMQPKSVWCH